MAALVVDTRCGCGYVLWGEELEDLRDDAERHIRDAHPELAETLSPLELAKPLLDDEEAA
jgi:hypothetical protein